ncbi:M1 family metallopeptidase [Undibacterium fentianense]|uniref:Aminopeptidase n=1 Tax=Undibacterium fentianense TaxID=2828728 RepID=A0A941IER0_9BURK|nr:M1 family metallopeptidase [Undibacterium fentianense]MBR7801378.1 M1 family metallopeptidase [Undibacterium fentianense]
MKLKLMAIAIASVVGLSSLSAFALVAPFQKNTSPSLLELAKVTTQLPRGVRPLHYDVALIPNASEASFSGKVKIHLDVLQARQVLTLNAVDLRFHKVRLLDGQGRLLRDNPKITLHPESQTASFDFSQQLKTGRYQLELEYEGVIGTQAVGLFSLDYDSPSGKQRALYTQFENSDARRVIPSWDEPMFKSTFNLEVTVPSVQLAVSNMPVLSKTALGDGKTRVKFATSPKMSTYLLFLSVGDFERATVESEGTEIGVIAKRGSLDQARYVLEESKGILREFNDYFGVRYPLPKLDNIAAPGSSQFFSAMENWGAIFTFESSILLDPAFSTHANKELAFVTAAHETAHQWFGNLVTMQWWDDLWLNEGFASWMENRTMMRLHPEWLPEFNAISVREQAIGRDALATTHAVVQKITTVDQASQAFDTITYQKGEAVIRMLENYVGADAWRTAVRGYMKKHAYANTQSRDLWQQVEKAAKKPIIAIAKDFTEQPGVPLIYVENVVCQNGKAIVSLRQSEFSKDLPNKKPLHWRVPVVAQIAGTKVEGRTLVVNGQAKLVLPECGVVVVNAGQMGYYRTQYAPPVFAQLVQHFSEVSAIDQVGILTDSWALGLAGQENIANYLDLAKATPANASSHVWGNIAGVFSTIDGYLKGDEAREKAFKQFAFQRLTPLLQAMGWDAKTGEAEYMANLRSNLIGVLGKLGEPSVLAEVKRRFDQMQLDPNAVPAALRLLILSIVAENADQATWDLLHAQAKNESSSLVRQSYYELLASSNDPLLAQRALDLALTDEPGLTISAGMIRLVAGGHPDLAFDFALSHIDKINERVDATSRSRYFPLLAAESTDPKMIEKLESFAKTHLDVSARREVDTVIAGIQYKMKVKQERLPALKAWLDAQ